MKHYASILLLLIVFTACKQETKSVINTDYSKENLDVTTSLYPEKLTNVFKAHGGIDKWNTFNTLEFTMKKPTGDEKTITDLKNRRSFIETDAFKIGYNGEEAWLVNKGENEYKGKPQFYYNLMFYFYAMPFILADDGITYLNVEPLSYNGKQYPGIKVSYAAGVGESPDDEYILYYDTETNKMAWLAYTVTYFTKEKSKDWSFIKYSDWQIVNGLELPKTLEWYKAEGFVIGEKHRDLLFTNVLITQDRPMDSMYEKPE